MTRVSTAEMSPVINRAILMLTGVFLVAPASSFAATKQCSYTAAPRSAVSIINQAGSIDIRPATGRQVSISATMNSSDAAIDCNQVGARISAVTRFAKSPLADEGRVDYEVLVPQDTSLSVRNSAGMIRLDGVRGDLTLRGDTASVQVSNVGDSHVHIQTVNGPVTLTNIDGGHIEVLSTGGRVSMNSVNAPKVSVSSTSGDVSYDGDFGHEGDYVFSNHSGAIDIMLPASASVDIDARSVRGSVQNGFPLQQKVLPGNGLISGHAFAGTSNSGSSSVELRSFSGTIRVKKR